MSEVVVPMDRARYRRVVRFFARAFVAIIWWDLIVRRVPGLGGWVKRSQIRRWQGIARRFRALAVDMGGVLIKLGQFLSARMDVLPIEVTSELAGLQDEVPPETLADVRGVIESEFGQPVEVVFEWLSPEPEAAASLAQVHKARRRDGQGVVVKVQRPGIETLVETDLAAIRVAVNWLKYYRLVADRVDLDRLFDEFATTTRNELDFIAEGKNAERFAENFADDPGIYIADVHWDYTTRRVLTLENVASIKITDNAAMDAAGISRPQVAARLYHAYLRQIFEHNFVHADPHPGNLFVRPLDRPEGSDPDAPRPFLLIFVDFGMMAVIPQRLRAHLRDYVIGFGLRDAHRIVQAYKDAGVLLPGADLKRLEEMHEVMFERLWGVKMGQMKDIAEEEMRFLLHEYRDLIYEMPFQFPADVLFVVRAVGILSGMATSLDPEFDPWTATIPFAEKLAAEEMGQGWRGWLDEIGEVARLALQLPGQTDRFFTQALRGDLMVQTSLAPDAARALRKLEGAVNRLTWAVIFAALLAAGVLLRANEGPSLLSYTFFTLALVALGWGATRR